MNQVILIGRLVADAQLKKTQQGKSIVTFSIAVDGYNHVTEFIRCTAFEKLAEVLNLYTKKGSRICVVGRLHTYSYENEKLEKRYITEVLVDNVQFLDSKKKEEKMIMDDEMDISLSDLPF